MDQKRFGALKWAILHNQKKMVESLLDGNAPVDIPPYEKKNYRTPLHSSVYLGDLDIVKKLLERGASPNVYNINRETPLMLAAKFDKHDIVDLLLSEKRLKNIANRENFTHLHIACMRNRVDVVRKLVKHGDGIDIPVISESIRWPGFTPLHFAVQYRSIETVKFLLSVGASITLKDSNQNTALHLADMARDVEIIDMILEAHENVVQNPTNREGMSHFHIACTRNNPRILERFIRHGVKLDDTLSDDSRNWIDFTAIDFAIYYDCIDNVKLLLMMGGRKLFLSQQYDLDRVRCAYGTGNVELVDLILKRDELPRRMIPIGKLPHLHSACIHRDLEAIKGILSESKIQLNKPLWQGSTPLHLAVERGDYFIVKYLVEQGAHCNIKNANGDTALHLAFRSNRNSLTYLISTNITYTTENHTDNDGISHLHIACAKSGIEPVEHLIKLGADVNSAVNLDSVFWPGFTPLHFAAKFESSGIAQLLLEHGASYWATDKDGLSAFDVAILECCFVEYDSISAEMEAILSYHSKHDADSFNDRGFSLLHALSSNYDRTDSIRKFLRDHPDDINKAVHDLNTPWDGYTPLHFAMAYGDPDHSELLIKSGADIFSKATSGDIPFHLSLTRGWRGHRLFDRPKITMDIFDFARMQNNPIGTRGDSLFHVACSTSNVEWIKYFLKHGVDPNLRRMTKGYKYDGDTPLHIVAKNRNHSTAKIVALLLEYGANATDRDSHLNTPLHHMFNNFEPAIIDLLIHHGVDVNSRNAFLETPLLIFCEGDYLGRRYDRDPEMIASLIDRGADINLSDEHGSTPLSISRWTREINDSAASIELLLKHLMKLEKIGLFVSKHNKQASITLLKSCSPETKSNVLKSLRDCSNERDRLRNIRINAYTTLLDILFKDLNEMSIISGNYVFQQMIGEDGFHKKFPVYGSMLKLQSNRGQIRMPLLSKSLKVFKSIMNISIPRECFERISQYLANDDLNNIITSWNR